VPIPFKDLGCLVAGEATAFGVGPLRDRVWPVTSYLAEQFRTAGFVPLGRTNVPEFGTTVTTEARSFQASYLLFDANFLNLVAVQDRTALTALRTSAVSVAAVRPRLLAASGPLGLAVFGAGPQAHGHVATVAAALTPHRSLATVTHLIRDASRVKPTDGADVVGLDSPQRGTGSVPAFTSSILPARPERRHRGATAVYATGSKPDADAAVGSGR
jgi:Amidase/Ornithine cyclodeaminase/mu-crystallin family